MRNFLISIEDKDFDKVKSALKTMDADFENDGQVLQELFIFDDRHGPIADVRNNIKVSEMEKEYVFKKHQMKDLS